jgi:hypothetical protein
METGAELLAHDIRDPGDNGGVLRNPDRVGRIAEQIAALRTHASEELAILADALDKRPAEADRDLQVVERLCRSLSSRVGSADQRRKRVNGRPRPA